MPEIKEGLLADLVGDISNLVPNLPGGMDEAIKAAVKTAVAVVDPNVPTPSIPQNPVILPEATPDQRNEIVKALDTVISSIGVALRFRFLIPDEFEKPLEYLAKGLTLLRGWMD
jgi:hypothetical protein